MPQISVRPEENSAYTAPISRPLTTTCRQDHRNYLRPLKGHVRDAMRRRCGPDGDAFAIPCSWSTYVNAQDVHPRSVVADAPVPHHELIRRQVGLRQGLANGLRLGGPGAIDGLGQGEESLHVAAAGVVQIHPRLRLVQLVDAIGRAPGLSDIPSGPVDGSLSDFPTFLSTPDRRTPCRPRSPFEASS